MYRSPIHKLSAWLKSPESVISSEYLKSIKSELSTEFGRDATHTISIDGISYDKETILKHLDDLITDKNLALHIFIYNNKILLHFLEDDKYDLDEFVLENTSIPAEITEELDTLVYEQTLSRIKTSSVGTNLRNLSILYTSGIPFTETQKQDLCVKAGQILDSVITKLSEHSGKNLHLPKEFDFLRTSSLPDFLNALCEVAPNKVDAFVEAVLHALIAYHNSVPKHDKKYLYEVSVLLCRINCGESLREMAQSYGKLFSVNYQAHSEDSVSPKKLSKAYWLVVILLFFIIRPVLTFLRSADSDAGQKNDPHNALQHWPKPKLTEAQRFTSYRNFIVSENHERAVEFTENVKVLDHKRFSGQSPFYYIIEPNNTSYDSTYEKIVVVNKSELELVLVTLYSQTADAFLFPPNHPDTLYVKPDVRLCFYFGDSLINYNDKVDLGDEYNAMAVNLELEWRFANRDPLVQSLFHENFILEFKGLPAGDNKTQKGSKKNASELRLDITEDFFITKKIENKKLKVYSDVSGISSR